MKGVIYNKRKNRFEATISYKGKRYYLGSSNCEEDAMMLRRLADIAKTNGMFEAYYQMIRCKPI